MTAERVVVGGSIAALVAADALARAGRRVRLLLPERGVGGGFAPLRADGCVLELGVRLLELSYEDDDAPVPPLADYAPGVAGHRPYIRLISEYVRGLVGDRLVAAPRPTMVVDGREVDDLLFTVDLSSLSEILDAGDRQAMGREAADAVRRAGPAGVLDGDPAQLDAMSLRDASLTNHGHLFHERFVAALCDKVLPGGASAVLASLRRKVWAPLFFPETLRRALAGRDTGFHPRRPFHTVAPDGCGALVDALVDRLGADSRVAIERPGALTSLVGATRATHLGFADGTTMVARRPLVGVSAAELFGAAGLDYAPERVRTALVWFERVQDGAPPPGAVTHVLDPDNPVLRVSAGGAATRGHRLLCVELRHDTQAEELGDAARRGLEAAGLVGADVSLREVRSVARPTFAAPSAQTRDRFATAMATFQRRGFDVDLLAGGTSAAADSFNEQVVQGLRAGAMAA
jgi:hypothetical protein